MSQIIATETLGKLYINHGVLDKAKDVYAILLEQSPDRNDYQTIIADLDTQIAQTEYQSKDYQQTLNQGFARDQNGMALDEALDAFDDEQLSETVDKKIVDPVILDQIMVMTDYESLEENVNISTPVPVQSVMTEEPAETMPDSTDDVDPLKQMVHKWIDLLLIKRKMNQLKRVKQRMS